ncbi:EAL domain-containing protein [Oceaniglobus indicus]|uniref:EAL domain-containing protein n=1 Tax=Oceaniglobus indicus TaxID=2047749 RepID=UPI000C19E1B5|nr:EAL domain-containing protein [Oceaniglobus indicus]
MRLLSNPKRGPWRLSILHFLVLLGLAIAVSTVTHGVEGAMFTAAIALAFILGTIDRRDLFRLRATCLARPQESRDTLEAGLSGPPDALCIVLEMDHLADLRQRWGKRALDDMEAQIVRRLTARIRSCDTVSIVAPGRFGLHLRASGDFGLEAAVQTTIRLQTCAQKPLSVDGSQVHVGLSAGFAHAARLAGVDASITLLAAAELALAAAQAAGPRSLRAFEPDMARHGVPTAPTVAAPGGDALRAALARGEFEPFFQPQIDCDTGALTGAEVLARWVHPTRGILAPATFLDLAEQHGCMKQLTDAILDTSLAQLADWDRRGVRIPRLSVNMGATDLADPMLIERVRWTLDRYGIAPGRLGIEILESVASAPDPDSATVRNILALGTLGCMIELDDFGTGSASIAGIRRFMVKRIKIDRSLVTALDTDRKQHEMIAAILTMAGQLDVQVLAEGVETPAEHAALAALGVGDLQGFAIARPMPADEMTRWTLRQERAEPPHPPALAGLISIDQLRHDAAKDGNDGKTA